MKCGKYHKIGISNDPDKRMRQLQTANPKKLELVAYVECLHFAEYFEAVLHAVFRDFNSNGEWFKVEDHSLHELANRFLDIDKAMSYLVMLPDAYDDEFARENYDLFLEYENGEKPND